MYIVTSVGGEGSAIGASAGRLSGSFAKRKMIYGPLLFFICALTWIRFCEMIAHA